jgi:hypothetical protein
VIAYLQKFRTAFPSSTQPLLATKLLIWLSERESGRLTEFMAFVPTGKELASSAFNAAMKMGYAKQWIDSGDRRRRPWRVTRDGAAMARDMSRVPVDALCDWAARYGANGELMPVTQIMAVYMVRNGPLHVGEFIHPIGVSSAAITGLTDRLEHLGLITKRLSHIDRRSFLAQLTLKGERAAKELVAILEPKPEPAKA